MLDFNALYTLPENFPGMDQLDVSTAYLMGCRSFSQFCCTVRSLAYPDQFCPFCLAELARRGRLPIRSNAYWRLLENDFPHKNTQRMLLAVPTDHATRLDEVNWAALGEILVSCGIESGGVMMRFGDPRFNVGSIEHLHVNIIEPTPGKEYRPPFAKNVAEHAEDYQRVLGFLAELTAKGGEQWLFSVAGIQETQPAA